jgi:hypothetical protein
MNMSRVLSTALVAGITLLGLASGGSAATITCGTVGGGTCSGNLTATIGTPIPQETQIFLTAATGTTFIGNVGANNGPALVDFSTGSTAVSAANGSATFTANPNNTTFPSLLVSVAAGFDFTDLTFSTLGNTSLVVNASNGGSFTINPLGSGLNQFLIAATGGTEFTFLSLSTLGGGFSQIKDVQISGLAPVPGPIVGAGLPGLLSALAGMVVLARRRRLSRV